VFHPSCWRKGKGEDPNNKNDDSWCDGILCDPPFGLRENIANGNATNVQVQNEEGVGKYTRFTGTFDKDGKHQSQCYVQDHPPEVLLERVSNMIAPVLKIASDLLSKKKRLVFLFPVFRSQEKLKASSFSKIRGDDQEAKEVINSEKSYLWVEPISDSQKDFEGLWNLNEMEEFTVLGRILPQHLDFRLISCKRSPCRSGSMARLIVVMEKK